MPPASDQRKPAGGIDASSGSNANRIIQHCIAVSDGLGCFRGIAAAGVELDDFCWLNTVIGNVKNARHGTYHKASPQHLPRYLPEFC